MLKISQYGFISFLQRTVILCIASEGKQENKEEPLFGTRRRSWASDAAPCPPEEPSESPAEARGPSGQPSMAGAPLCGHPCAPISLPIQSAPATEGPLRY